MNIHIYTHIHSYRDTCLHAHDCCDEENGCVLDAVKGAIRVEDSLNKNVTKD